MIVGESRACRADVPPWAENPYRLVSLGEIMEIFLAERFLELASRMGIARLPELGGDLPISKDELLGSE